MLFYKCLFTACLLLVVVCTSCESAWAKIVIYSQTAVDIELIGYNGLADGSLFKGSISAGDKHETDTPYHGLALLIFAGGQRYPIIIGDDFFTLKIAGPTEPPSFAGSGENEYFYKLLSGGDPYTGQYNFALLMIQAKQLLESSHSIHTIKELAAKKKEFQEYVGDHFESLKHSDMVRRLIAQYFMMHEYVDYHTEGAPATDIQVRYQKAVLNGVKSWLRVLKSHIPEHEILNYCVSLYYNRSMVALANLFIHNFRDVAYCPGVKKETFTFPGDLSLTEADRTTDSKLDEVNGEKVVTFVSEDCPVSLVTTVIKARKQVGQKKDVQLIVAPLEKLSEKHLIMNRMISGGGMLFINDKKWKKENLAKKIKLPLFVTIEDGKVVKVAN